MQKVYKWRETMHCLILSHFLSSPSTQSQYLFFSMSTEPLMSSGGRMPRRTAGTPYARPRQPGALAVSGGWLSKLVDFGVSLISHVSFWCHPNADKELKKVHGSGVDSTLPMVTKVKEPPASPCELAKSYMGTMGTRPLQISPTRLGLQTLLMGGDPPALSNKYQFPQPSNRIPAPNSTTPILENGHVFTRMQQRSRIMTCYLYARLPSPVLWKTLHTGRQAASYMSARPLSMLGRSAISRVACHPYARLPPPVVSKSIHVSNGGYTGQPTSLQQTPIIDRQMLKRKSLAREDNAGYGGSILRARPKTDWIAPSKDMHASALGNALPSPLVPVPSHVETKENGGFGKHIASYTSVPPQSSAMAQKILSELETITSPKAESSKIKLTMARRVEEDTSNLEIVLCNDGNFKVPAGGNNLFEPQLSLSQTNTKPEENEKLEINLDEDQRHVKPAFRMSVSEDAMEDDDETGETISSRAHVLSIDGKSSEKSQISAFSSTNNISSTFELKCSAGFDVKPLTLVSSANTFERQSENTDLDEKGENEKEVDLLRPAVSPLLLSRGFGSSSQLASTLTLLGSSSSICS